MKFDISAIKSRMGRGKTAKTDKTAKIDNFDMAECNSGRVGRVFQSLAHTQEEKEINLELLIKTEENSPDLASKTTEENNLLFFDARTCVRLNDPSDPSVASKTASPKAEAETPITVNTDRPPLFDHEGHRIAPATDFSAGTFDDHGAWTPLSPETPTRAVPSTEMRVVVKGVSYEDVLSATITPLVNGVCPVCGFKTFSKWLVNCPLCIERSTKPNPFAEKKAPITLEDQP